MRSKYHSPALAKQSGDVHASLLYTGPSMRPTLKPMDRLHIFPYGDQQVRCGDVVVFRFPGSDRKIIHRVISIAGNRIRTRGDNNRDPDPYIFRTEDIMGRVGSVQRDGKRRHISGGIRGQILAFTVRVLQKIRHIVSIPCRPAYRRLSRSDLFKRRLPFFPKTRVLCFNKSGETDLQLLMGNRIVGRRSPDSSQWEIKPPYRLFIDETSLPVKNRMNPAPSAATQEGFQLEH